MVVPDWKPSDYFKSLSPAIAGASPFDEREKLKKMVRCVKCWELRLEKTAEYAKKNGFGAFSSTLLTSEYQNSEMIEKIGKKIGKNHNIKFLIPNKICKKLETKGFYKQVFCGCCYSLVERFEEKFSG